MVGLPTLRMSKHRDLVIDQGRLRIPRNTTIWIPLGLPHASSAIYQQADCFVPERWLEPNADYTLPSGEQLQGLPEMHKEVLNSVAARTEAVLHSSLVYCGIPDATFGATNRL